MTDISMERLQEIVSTCHGCVETVECTHGCIPHCREVYSVCCELIRLRKVLAWYAIAGHYISDSKYMGGGQGPTSADIDGGRRARAALTNTPIEDQDAEGRT